MAEKFSTERLVEVMRDQKRRQEQEFRKWLKNHDAYIGFTLLTDALLNNLNHLCNYSKVISHTGEEVDSSEVLHELGQQIKATFLLLTGREYQPDICRLIDQRVIETIRQRSASQPISREERQRISGWDLVQLAQEYACSCNSTEPGATRLQGAILDELQYRQERMALLFIQRVMADPNPGSVPDGNPNHASQDLLDQEWQPGEGEE